MLLHSGSATAQCTGCTATITTNTSAVTINSGQVVCINYVGTFTKTITFNGGTLCIGPSTTVSSGITMPGGGALNIYGTYSGSMSQNGGDITVYSGGNFRPSSFNVNGGTLTISSGGSSTLGTPSFPSGYVFNDYGTLSIAGFTLNSGATVNISGTSTTISNSVTNNGNLTITGPATISGAFSQNSGAASSFISGVTVTGSVSNNGTINLNGSFSVGGSYTSNSGAYITATGTTGCNTVTVSGSISGSGGFNGGGNSMTISPTPSCCMSNGATAVPTTPTSSPTSLSATLTDNVISGSFTAPAASIGAYLVLRYIGTSAPSCSPTNNTAYNAGDAIGTCTVAAIVAGGSTGTKYFTDTIDPATTNCGKKVYYRIFSYSGSGACTQYRTTSPLTGYVTMASFTTSVTASGSTSFCSGIGTTLTAGTAATYTWSSGESTAAISPTSTGTYTVTATSTLGCTATASKALTVYSIPTVTATSNTPVCVGSAIALTATASGSTSYTYAWSGPASFSAATASASVSSATAASAGSYTITVTDNHSCTATATTAVAIDATCVDSTTTGANGGGSSDAPCTQILRFDHYSDAIAASGQSHTWVLNNGNRLSMTITRTAGGFTAVSAPTWSGAAFGQSGYTGLRGKTVLYTTAGGYSQVAFTNIQMTDSAGNAINNFTLIGIDAESTDGSERDTLVSNGTFWYDYDTITPPSVGSVPSETGIGLSTLVWAGTGPSNARARLVSTNNPTSFTFSTVAGGLQGFAMGVSNPVQAPSTATICSGSSFNANPTNLPAGTTYTWAAPIVSPAGSLTGATAQSTPTATVGQTLVNTGLSAATATYTIVPSNNCSGQGYTVTVTVNPKPVASIFGNTSFCPGGSTTLTASGGSTYAWSTGAATAALTVSTAGTYTVTVTSASGCTATASRTVTMSSNPTPAIAGTTTICAGSSTTLTASGGTSYSWSTGATTAAISASTAGSYTVTVTNASGCTATASATVTVTPLPSAAIAGSTSICSGGSTVLTASGGGTYAWSTGATTAAITAGSAATYTVTVTSSGCTATASTTVTVNANPTASISGTASFCPGGSTTLTASGGTSYSWSTGAATAALTVSTAGTYTVTVTNASGCTATASRTVTMSSNPTPAIAGTTTICAGSSTTLTASGGTSYSWSTGATTAAISASTAGSYTVTVTNASGCTATASATVTVTPLPSAAIAGSTSICSGGSTVLTASGGGTYAWSTGATTAAITAGSAATYTVTVTSSGCTATASTTVTLNANPTASISGTTSFCPGASTTITAAGGTSYSWSTGAATAALTVSTAGTYTVTVTNASGCTATASRSVTAGSIPVATATSATACTGSSATLTATGGGTYLWSTGATTAAISASTAGSYTVTVTNAAGCTATAAGTLSSYALPVLSISSNSPVCIGAPVSLSVTASGAASYTYAWTGPNSFTATSAAPSIASATVSNSGTYSVTVTDNHTCSAAATVAVGVSACLSVSGYVFDDGNGNGLVGPRDTVSAFGQTLYAVVSDTTGRVVSSGPVSANGSFSISGLTPSTRGLKLRISTTQPAAGDSVAAPSWPANYLGTLGQYGINNLAGTGVYSGTDEIIPLRTGSSDITGIYIGFDRLMPAQSQLYTISRPPRHTIKTLTAAAGLGDITWTDPEDGANKGSFVVSSVNAMRGNILFYDSNGNNAFDTVEMINGYKVIRNFVNSKLKMKFEGVASINAQFSFGYMDSAGKVNPSSSTYKIQWTNGALPVKLEYFTAEKKDERSAIVKWATASEINNDHFEVERSADAQQWTRIGTVPGAGNSNDHLDYSLDDNDPLPGINYYRLKQVDYDGQYEYSDIAEVEFSGEEGMHSATVMTIYPNPLPAGKPLHIALAGPSDQIKTVLIHTALGQQVYRNDPAAGEGYTLPGLTFSAGTYIVTVLTTTNESFTAQIVIQ